MILTDREIQIALEQGLLTIDPAPGERAYSSTSVDLTLDLNYSRFKKPIKGIQRSLSPSDEDFDHEGVLSEITENLSIPAEGVLFHPGDFILAWTKEYVELKLHARLAARVEGKSSLARLGIAVHITAPVIHAGFDGQIRLEMINHGELPILLKPDMRICQLVFEQTLGTPVKGYKGRFSGQTNKKQG